MSGERLQDHWSSGCAFLLEGKPNQDSAARIDIDS